LRRSVWRCQKVLLDQIDAAMAQDVISRRDVKKELRYAESQQQGLPVNLRPEPLRNACLIASLTWRVRLYMLGSEACIEQNRGIDLSRLGVNSRMVEKPGQTAQKLTETPMDNLCIEMVTVEILCGWREIRPLPHNDRFCFGKLTADADLN
jgi:hypothetical protein